jgi:polysaccharide deacetylase family protein (PEP-CTERM system associated)
MESSPESMLNAFTVDVEDYFQVSAFETCVARERWPEFESRVEANTLRIADLLDETHVRGTFFILGWVAKRFPGLVRELHARGHEIGSHSYWHRLIYSQAPEEFREDLKRSRDVLQDLLGVPVVAYRAPSFSITQKSLWALDILSEEGFQIDSSIFPVYHDRYGIAGARPDIHFRETASGPLAEFPPTVFKLGWWNLPVSGGGYFRLYPFAFTRYCLSQVNKRTKHPFMFYIHPWEVDPQQPRLPGPSAMSKMRHYVNLHTTEAKLRMLLGQFEFGRVDQIVAKYTDLIRSAC